MRAIFQMEMLKNLQDRGLLFWMILLPIIFTVLFISIFTVGVDPAMKKEVISSIVPGYIVMFVFFIMISMVSAFVKDKESGMVARLASTPLSPKAYLFGKWLLYMLVVFIQITILFGFGKAVYQIPLEQPIYLFFLALFLVFSVTGLGLALALFAKTENMGIAITQLIALGGAMLGGLWVPFEIMPDLMQSIAKVLPQYWAHQAFQDAMEGVLTGKVFFSCFAVLLSYGVLGFILALVKYPSYLTSARN